MKPTVIFDIEIYTNYLLVAFMNTVTLNIRHFEMFAGQPLDVKTLREVLQRYRLVSFNGIQFDLPLITMALKGLLASRSRLPRTG